MLCRGRIISLFTLNGDLLLDQDICADVDDIIVSCAFYEGSGNEYLARDLIFTGHKRGIVNVSSQWSLLVPSVPPKTSADMEQSHTRWWLPP